MQAPPRQASVLLPRPLVPGLGLGTVALLVAGVLVPLTVDASDGADTSRVLRALDFEAPASLPAWWTSVLLLLVALLAWSRGARAGLAGHSGDSVRWRLLAVLAAYASFDHATRVHVAVARAMDPVLPRLAQIDPLGLALAGCALAVSVPLLRSIAPARERALAGAAGALVLAGGWGFDALAALLGAAPSLALAGAESGLLWTGLVALVVLLLPANEERT